MPEQPDQRLTARDKDLLKSMTSFDDIFAGDGLSDAGEAFVKMLYIDPETKRLPPREHTLFDFLTKR